MRMSRERNFYSKLDMIVMGGILVAALLLYGAYLFINRHSGTATAEIIHDGAVVKTVRLDKEDMFSLQENPNVVFHVKDNAIRFEESDCLDKLCVHTGYVNHGGQLAACLPNKLAIRIIVNSDSSPDTPDIISY